MAISLLMRYACTLIVSWALLLSFAGAPLWHVHQVGDGADHHAVEQRHLHLPRIATQTDDTVIGQIDPADDERLVSWFQIVPHGGFVFPAVPRAAGVIALLVARDFVRPAPFTRSHDPPLISCLPARSPPISPA